MILYNLQELTSGELAITKFDNDFNVESSYKVSDIACECPQGHKPTCRHRRMLSSMAQIVDTDIFYCFDTSTYHKADGSIVMPGIDFGQPSAPQAIPGLQPVTPSPFRRRI